MDARTVSLTDINPTSATFTSNAIEVNNSVLTFSTSTFTTITASADVKLIVLDGVSLTSSTVALNSITAAGNFVLFEITNSSTVSFTSLTVGSFTDSSNATGVVNMMKFDKVQTITLTTMTFGFSAIPVGGTSKFIYYFVSKPVDATSV
jgi:hypothetical protein